MEALDDQEKIKEESQNQLQLRRNEFDAMKKEL